MNIIIGRKRVDVPLFRVYLSTVFDFLAKLTVPRELKFAVELLCVHCILYTIIVALWFCLWFIKECMYNVHSLMKPTSSVEQLTVYKPELSVGRSSWMVWRSSSLQTCSLLLVSIKFLEGDLHLIICNTM